MGRGEDHDRSQVNMRRRIGRNAVMALVVFCSTAFAQATLPKPTGSYAVGRRLLYILDSARADNKAIRADHKREFMTIVWYPAVGSVADAAGPWIPALWADSAAGDLFMFTRRVTPPLTV